MSEEKKELISADAQEHIDTIREVVCSYGLLATAGESPFKQMLLRAQGIKQLRKLISGEVLDALKELQGSRLGFRTDKDSSGGYKDDVIRDVAAEALIRGANMVGNEVNIIASGCYLTLEYFDRMCHAYPGVANLEVVAGVPALIGDKGALVPMRATYLLNGVSQTFAREKWTDANGQERDERIPVRVNAGQIVDAIVGKAKRKFLAALFQKLSGISLPDADQDVDATVVDAANKRLASDNKKVGHSSVNEQMDAEKPSGKKSETKEGDDLF